MLRIKIRILHSTNGFAREVSCHRHTDTSGDLWTTEKEWRHSTPMKTHKTRKNEFLGKWKKKHILKFYTLVSKTKYA
jgi:hypothetical protein